MEDYYILSFSGGKDSTAMSIEWLKRHKQNPVEYPLDEVICCDTGMEFPAMEVHINKVEQVFKEAKIKFTRLKSEYSFEYYLYEHEPKKKRKSDYIDLKGWGFPKTNNRWCTSALKTRIIDKYVKDLKKNYNVIKLLGIAFDEQERLKRKAHQVEGLKFPLVEWEWTEKDCLQYCYDNGFDWKNGESVGLYELFDRTSCWCCPLQSLPDLRNLRKHFPDLWERLLDMQHKTFGEFRQGYTVDQLEIRFQLEDKRLLQGLPIRNRDFYAELRLKLNETNVR